MSDSDMAKKTNDCLLIVAFLMCDIFFAKILRIPGGSLLGLFKFEGFVRKVWQDVAEYTTTAQVEPGNKARHLRKQTPQTTSRRSSLTFN